MSVEKEDEKVVSLNRTLTSVENNLLHRAIERKNAALDVIVGDVLKAAADGAVEIDYGNDDGEHEESDSDDGDTDV